MERKPIGDNTLISIADDCNPTPSTVTAEVAVRSLYARMELNPSRTPDRNVENV